jgi:hypothetical protein
MKIGVRFGVLVITSTRDEKNLLSGEPGSRPKKEE